jgi:PEP-CTERM motif
MRRITASLALLISASVFLSPSASAINLTPYTSFGGGDGWLAPGENGYTFLGTAGTERGLAFGHDHLYLVSRNGGNNVRILDKNSGADVGALITPPEIISGGTFPLNNVAVSDEGFIYVANLTTAANTGAGAFRVYSWTSEAALPLLVYSGDTDLPGARVGDDLAAIGSGYSTLLISGYGSSPSVVGNNGFAIVGPLSGAAHALFFGTQPAAGEFRSSVTFIDANYLLGAGGSSFYRYVRLDANQGTILASPSIPDPAGASGDRLLAYTTLNGKGLLAIQNTVNAHVSIYDVTNPAAPVWLASGNNTSGTLAANGDGTGELVWGPATLNPNGTMQRILYAMSTNQGIQAFVVSVPEPGTLFLVVLLLGLAGLGGHRRS